MFQRKKGKQKRFCWIENNVTNIPLQNGKIALCDADRFEEVKNMTWQEKGTIGNKYVSGFNGEKSITLHKFLYPKIKLIDHINGNSLDNRACNLREATISQNGMNSKMQKNNKSGYKGVNWSGHNKCWEVRITINKKQCWLKNFDNIVEAAKFYDEKAREIYKEFARLNFPKENELKA